MKTADREPDASVSDVSYLSPLGESVTESIRRECLDPEFRREWARVGVAEQVAQTLIRFRGDRGLSQGAAARLLGMTESMVSRLERGDRVPNVDTMLRVAEATGTVLRV
jgi:ribosome-binding protein aMBF1 (putative translation factor)